MRIILRDKQGSKHPCSYTMAILRRVTEGHGGSRRVTKPWGRGHTFLHLLQGWCASFLNSYKPQIRLEHSGQRPGCHTTCPWSGQILLKNGRPSSLDMAVMVGRGRG